MTTAIDIAREIFPNWDDASLDSVIWERTGFPAFFALKEGQSHEDRMREQLIEFRDALARMRPGDQLCDHCENLALPGKWECFSCGFWRQWHTYDSRRRRTQTVCSWSIAVIGKWLRFDFRTKP